MKSCIAESLTTMGCPSERERMKISRAPRESNFMNSAILSLLSWMNMMFLTTGGTKHSKPALSSAGATFAACT